MSQFEIVSCAPSVSFLESMPKQSCFQKHRPQSLIILYIRQLVHYSRQIPRTLIPAAPTIWPKYICQSVLHGFDPMYRCEQNVENCTSSQALNAVVASIVRNNLEQKVDVELR